MRNTANFEHIDVWWRPDCGYLHLERDPVGIGMACPDGVHPDEGGEGVVDDGID